jgi:hypothetical protein
MTSDPICGSCGNPLSAHYHEDKAYCFHNTTGDIFTSEPSDSVLMGFAETHFPHIHKELVQHWKMNNGHPTPDCV